MIIFPYHRLDQMKVAVLLLKPAYFLRAMTTCEKVADVRLTKVGVIVWAKRKKKERCIERYYYLLACLPATVTRPTLTSGFELLRAHMQQFLYLFSKNTGPIPGICRDILLGQACFWAR